MEEIIIPLDGKDTKIEVRQIALQNLLLDEQNPRISYFRDNQIVEHLADNDIIFALTNKKPEAFRKLKDSIQNNRGIMQPIWVEPLSNGTFRIVEGNSRYVVYRQLNQEEPFEEKWKTILCYVLPYEIQDEKKDYIRLQSHLRGTTEWDAYEKAKYLYRLWQIDGWSINRLEKQTKMTEKQIKENIDAYKLMEEQYLPIHGDDPNEVNKFSYFVEYVKDQRLQKIMKKNKKETKDFCEWVFDKKKIPGGQDVRRLRDILENEETKKVFFERDFDSAIQVLEFKRPNLVSSFYRDIENITEKLKDISAQELDEIINESDSEKEKMIRDLARWSKRVVEIIEEEKIKNGIH
jgi:hypothetical protein